MKKYFVLTLLFALPIVAYLFFSSGINHFAILPTLTKPISEIDNFHTFQNEEVRLKDHISVLFFMGNRVKEMEGHAFNLNEKIYDKNYQFKDFQFVVLAENGQEQAAQDLLNQLGTTIDVKNWKFAFGSQRDIQRVFESLQTHLQLNEGGANEHVFIIDKELALRGRKDEEDKSVVENYGYDTSSVAELSNIMSDDIKVILAEYRLATKGNAIKDSDEKL